MKKTRLVLLIVVALLGITVPLYAQEAGLTLEDLAARVEAMVELISSMSDRLATYEERLAALEATATPTVTPTPSPTPPPTADSNGDLRVSDSQHHARHERARGPGNQLPHRGSGLARRPIPHFRQKSCRWMVADHLWRPVRLGLQPAGDSNLPRARASGARHTHTPADPYPDRHAHPAHARPPDTRSATRDRPLRRHRRRRLQIQAAKYGSPK